MDSGEVYKQLKDNPKAEICACMKDQWSRVSGEIIEDDRREARQSMLDDYPSLQAIILQMMAIPQYSIFRMQLQYSAAFRRSRK